MAGNAVPASSPVTHFSAIEHGSIGSQYLHTNNQEELVRQNFIAASGRENIYAMYNQQFVDYPGAQSAASAKNLGPPQNMTSVNVEMHGVPCIKRQTQELTVDGKEVYLVPCDMPNESAEVQQKVLNLKRKDRQEECRHEYDMISQRRQEREERRNTKEEELKISERMLEIEKERYAILFNSRKEQEEIQKIENERYMASLKSCKVLQEMKKIQSEIIEQEKEKYEITFKTSNLKQIYEKERSMQGKTQRFIP